MIEGIMGEKMIENLEGITLPRGYEIVHSQETLDPPAGTYFIRSVRTWTPAEDLTINQPEISVSLQKDGQTLPLRPYGYILEIDKGGVINAYDRDVTSEVGEKDTKIPSPRASRTIRTYSGAELDELIGNTRPGSHNELIVRGDHVHRIKAYVIEGTQNVPGLARFKKDCQEKGLEIHQIPKQLTELSLSKQKLIELSIPKTLRGLIAKNFNNDLHITDSQGNPIAESALKPENVLGKGDTSLVLIGESVDRKPRALKIYVPTLLEDQDRSRRLLSDEALISKDMDHPNIAKFYGLGEIKITATTRFPVIIREVIPHTLKEISSKQQLSHAEIMNFLNATSGALAYLYAKNRLIVTDLTPGNLGKREDGSWAVVDLGHLAKPGTTKEVAYDMIYSPPEFRSGSDEEKNNSATPASEVYQLGLIVWELLTGKDVSALDHVFRPNEVITQENLSNETFAVLKRATLKNPSDRYQTPAKFANELEATFQS